MSGVAIDQLDRSAGLDRSIDALQSLIDQSSIDQQLNRSTIDRPTGLIDRSMIDRRRSVLLGINLG
jgi:hypothetical protein